MIQKQFILIIALLFPIVVLFTMTLYKRHILMTGYEVILPISGYDPRDLLSGNYVTYTIDYGIADLCRNTANIQQGYICLEENKTFSLSLPRNCKKLIRGICNNGRFVAGIEKYYIPANQAKYLDAQIKEKTTSIVISVTPSGKAQVKNLLINGIPWRKN